jgi:hypothetical protein
MLTEIILWEIKTFEFVAFKIICLLQNTTNLLCVIVNSLMRRFSEQNIHVSLDLNYFRETHIFDTVDAVGAVCVCAPESNIRQATLYRLFVVMSGILFEQTVGLKISVKCLRTLLTSPNGRLRLPFARVARIYCRHS